jgi:hypothetical protein
VQSSLIPAHVTLCREDELSGVSLDALTTRLAGCAPLRLAFADVVAFGGHGIMARCSEGAELYSQLRRSVLGVDAREAKPHITLAHPRILERLAMFWTPSILTFRCMSYSTKLR